MSPQSNDTWKKDITGCFSLFQWILCHVAVWVFLQKWQVISPSSGDWEVEGRGSNSISVWKGLPSWSIEDCLLCPHVVDRQELSGASFINEDSNLIQEGSTLMTYSPPSGPIYSFPSLQLNTQILKRHKYWDTKIYEEF